MSGAKTGIQWTQRTWNPVVGCSRVSEGCRNCYAETMARRIACAADARASKGDELTETQRAYQRVVRSKRDMCPSPGEAPPSPSRGEGAGGAGEAVRLPQWNGNVVLIEEKLTKPLRVKKPTMWFVNSMSDLFHEKLRDEDIDRIFAVMALCPQHTFQVLTKRPERMAEYLSMGDPRRRVFEMAMDMAPGNIGDRAERIDEIERWPLPNVWLGASAEDQANLDTRLPHLLRCPAAVRFLSLEPLLGPIDLSELKTPRERRGIAWVIVGGESGHDARPCDVKWVRDIVRQCKSAGVPVFVKQLGSTPMLGDVSEPHGWPTTAGPVNWETGRITLRDSHGADMSEWPIDLRVREMPVGGSDQSPVNSDQFRSATDHASLITDHSKTERGAEGTR